MDRTVFAARFSEAAEQSRAFAQTLVSEPLPGDVVVRVRLNRSYPGARLRPGEVTYPGDGGWEQDFALRRCGLGTAVSVLWRDGRVPEWVNLTVIDRDESVTVVEAVCCGRFTDARFHLTGTACPAISGDTASYTVEAFALSGLRGRLRTRRS